jgi:hypothetical protein
VIFNHKGSYEKDNIIDHIFFVSGVTDRLPLNRNDTGIGESNSDIFTNSPTNTARSHLY